MWQESAPRWIERPEKGGPDLSRSRFFARDGADAGVTVARGTIVVVSSSYGPSAGQPGPDNRPPYGRPDPSRTPPSVPPTKREGGDKGVPSWWVDLRAIVLVAFGLAAGATVILLFASTGLMHHENTGAVIEADSVLAGVLAGFGVILWPLMKISGSRPDHGFRRHGLPGLMIAGVLAATAVDLVAMIFWPLIVGERASSFEVAGSVIDNPLSLGVLAAFLVTMHCWSVACALGFVRGGMRSSLVTVAGFLAMLGIGMWQGTRIMGSPPSGTVLGFWSVLALLALAAMVVISALAGPDRTGR